VKKIDITNNDAAFRIAIIEVMNQLKPSFREILVMHYFEEMGIQEMSEEIGISTFSTRVRLCCARRKLTQKLNEYMSKNKDVSN
jgi:RNA polymerase sigma factor (sigma-70 family)